MDTEARIKELEKNVSALLTLCSYQRTAKEMWDGTDVHGVNGQATFEEALQSIRAVSLNQGNRGKRKADSKSFAATHQTLHSVESRQL
jgi:hypothetical protein